MKIYFKKLFGLALVTTVTLVFDTNISGENKIPDESVGETVILHSTAESYNGTSTKANSPNLDTKIEAPLKEETSKKQTLDKSNTNGNNKTEETKNRDRTQNDSKFKDDKKMSTDSSTKPDKSNLKQQNSGITINNKKVNNAPETNHNVQAEKDNDNSVYEDNNLQNLEEVSQNNEEHLNGAFDFIKSNTAQNNWIGDGKILLYMGILLISVSVLGITFTLMPKRKRDKKVKIS